MFPDRRTLYRAIAGELGGEGCVGLIRDGPWPRRMRSTHPDPALRRNQFLEPGTRPAIGRARPGPAAHAARQKRPSACRQIS